MARPRGKLVLRAHLGPMEVLLATFRSIETMPEDSRPFTEPAQEVIARPPRCSYAVWR